MSRSRDPFQTALEAVLAVLDRPDLPPGAPLPATALAAELGLSPTPVREALARLAGEGVLEHLPLKGYFAPRRDAQTLRDLAELHGRLVDWSLELAEGPCRPLEIADPVLACEAVFAAVVDRARRPILSQAQRRAALQLRPARRLEMALSADWGGAVSRLQAAARSGDRQRLRESCDAFHRSSAALAEKVAARLPPPISDMGRILFE